MTEKKQIKNFDLEFKVLLAINCLAMGTVVGCFAAMVVMVFRGEWNYVVGFMMLTFASGYIFRLLPNPKTVSQRQQEDDRMFARLGLGRRR